MKHRSLTLLVVGLLGAGAAHAQTKATLSPNPTGVTTPTATTHALSATGAASGNVAVQPVATTPRERMDQLELLMKQDPANREAYEAEYKLYQAKYGAATNALTGPVQ